MMKLIKNLREKSRRLAKDTEGFTLIEMMIVIAIIGLLGTFVGISVTKRFDEAKVSATKTQIRQLGVVLEDFRRVCGFYPTTEQGLQALVEKPQGRECKNYDPEGFLKNKKIPQDSWGGEYMYTSDGNKFTIRSYGQDQAEGGTGVAADISSDELD